ncbi:hypothetical protein M1494_01495 [Candidatus Parvarchaeota archaeon]|nr:hypothetical protein [Candidatus Parvarchaeota archaeon]
MGIKQKLSALISGGAGVGLLSAGGVEEAKAESYYNKYNTIYNLDWNRFYNVWKNDPSSALRQAYPTYSAFKTAFDNSFNTDFGYLLTKAAPYQNDATLLLGLGAVAVAASAYLFYRSRKQSRLEKTQKEKE